LSTILNYVIFLSGHRGIADSTPQTWTALEKVLYRARGFGLDDRGFEFQQALGIFLFAIASTPALGPTQPSCPVGTRGSFHEVKVAGT
jgi:hypothetical protein